MRRARHDQRATTREVGERFMQVFNAYQEVIEAHKTGDLSESQFTKGNIEGRLTTIETKAFGNLQKIGGKANYIGVLKHERTSTSMFPAFCGER